MGFLKIGRILFLLAAFCFYPSLGWSQYEENPSETPDYGGSVPKGSKYEQLNKSCPKEIQSRAIRAAQNVEVLCLGNKKMKVVGEAGEPSTGTPAFYDKATKEAEKAAKAAVDAGKISSVEGKASDGAKNLTRAKHYEATAAAQRMAGCFHADLALDRIKQRAKALASNPKYKNCGAALAMTYKTKSKQAKARFEELKKAEKAANQAYLDQLKNEKTVGSDCDAACKKFQAASKKMDDNPPLPTKPVTAPKTEDERLAAIFKSQFKKPPTPAELAQMKTGIQGWSGPAIKNLGTPQGIPAYRFLGDIFANGKDASSYQPQYRPVVPPTTSPGWTGTVGQDGVLRIKPRPAGPGISIAAVSQPEVKGKLDSPWTTNAAFSGVGFDHKAVDDDKSECQKSLRDIASIKLYDAEMAAARFEELDEDCQAFSDQEKKRANTNEIINGGIVHVNY